MSKQNNFKEIYNEHRLLVYNLALTYLFSIEDAEEVTQDVFVKVHESLNKFKGNAALKTWIYRITVNQCLDFIKRRNSKKRFFVFGKKSNSEHEYNNFSNFEHPGILLENKEKSILLFKTINTLPENQKTAFILSKIDGLSNPEIAEVMELSIGAIESLLVRAKKGLQQKLGENFEEYRRKK
ncbi:RNA polymerase sigma factor [Flavobacterium arcticum]|uniref:RNA polymerase sigma factor n=1 Tax=Flavobacterium arcticum TaxID=1784713 RepID=A0A345HCQ0_9FLAO|nr:RNA polymerase sigma factor [Flavobacterium arcticum]AXG74360.1 RNA polymerase sigma factor [Flavobacterium arcticum]KAF2507525.1 RNA polymerase sigma factor [Flavobacterium arcticum]